jgi:cell shape-determining protein MreC
MTSLLATRTARRRSIAFTVLVAVSLVMMAFSSNASVRELQNGVGFAFRPIQSALDQVAGGVASVANAIAEIDRLRVDNAALRAENEQLTNGQAVTDEVRRENDQLTSLLQLQAGFDHKTVAAPVISRDSSEFKRVIGLGKGTNDGI